MESLRSAKKNIDVTGGLVAYEWDRQKRWLLPAVLTFALMAALWVLQTFTGALGY